MHSDIYLKNGVITLENNFISEGSNFKDVINVVKHIDLFLDASVITI